MTDHDELVSNAIWRLKHQAGAGAMGASAWFRLTDLDRWIAKLKADLATWEARRELLLTAQPPEEEPAR